MAAYKDMVCQQFLRCVAHAPSPDDFWAEISTTWYPDFQMLHARVARHELLTTRRTIRHENRAYLAAAFPLAGRMAVEQERSQTELSPGEFAFWDSTKPGRLWFDEGVDVLVIRTPVAWAEALIAGPRRREGQLAHRFAHVGASALVADFVQSFARLGERDEDEARVLSRSVPALLGSVLALADARQPDQMQAWALSRVEVVKYLQANLADPLLDADKVARAFNVSRSTLYRLFAEPNCPTDEVGEAPPGESLRAILRRIRVNHAAQLLRSDQQKPLRVVAQECGFGAEATFHRTFLRHHGRTAIQFRAALGHGPS